MCYKEGIGNKVPITSVQLSQQNLPLIPSRHGGCARRKVEWRGGKSLTPTLNAPPSHCYSGGGWQPHQTARVCEAASGGNVRAMSQHLVSPPEKQPRDAPQPAHLRAFPEHPLSCASPAPPIPGKDQSICRTCWWGAGRLVQEHLQCLTLTQQLGTPDGLFLRGLQRKNSVLRHADSVFQRGSSPQGFVSQDG